MYSFIIFFFTLFFTLSQSFPISLGKRDVSSSLLSQFQFIEQYAAAAYCAENNNPSTITAITCNAGNCPLVQSAGATTMLEFQNVGLPDVTGYIAVDKTSKMIVLSFRGSRSISNWLANLDLGLTSWNICSGCQVHSGFLSSWLASKNKIVTAMSSAVKQYPEYSVVATGHSAGGALASIATAELREQGFKIALYTFGSPMVGNSQFATLVTNQAGGNYRVTHDEDIIPKLPGYLIGYRHISPEYWIKVGDNTPVAPKDIAVSSGTLNLWGNQGTWGSNIDNHYWYFNDISLCSSGSFEF